MTYSPWRHVGSLPEIEVWCGDELAHADAYWEPDHRVILIDRRLGQAARRSRLAHELAHIDRGDERCAHGPDADRLNRRQERYADELAARRLIPFERLLTVLQVDQDEHQHAQELGVDLATLFARIRAVTPTERDRLEQTFRARQEDQGAA